MMRVAATIDCAFPPEAAKVIMAMPLAEEGADALSVGKEPTGARWR